jgi:long-subunit acyl-CoA synthetase (AMP-forming)/alkylation response protein AidB-like acyl-CoA dehydrogenase
MNPEAVVEANPDPVGVVEATSLVELFVRRIQQTPGRVALARRQQIGRLRTTSSVARSSSLPTDSLRTWTWLELAAAALRVADELESLGLRRGDRVCHLGAHSVDWIVADLACLLVGVVHVPLHADAAPREHREQLGWLAPRGVITSGGLKLRDPAAGRARLIVAPGVGWLDPSGPLEAEAIHAALARRAAQVDPEACCTIMLSSGTTGRPRGVLHSQRALAANAQAAATVFLDDPRDVRLSWLPASHALARVGDLYTAIVRGGCLHVVSDRRLILDACRALPPTVILGVPAFFERLEAAATSGRISDLAAALGGEVRVCISGGSPLRRRTAACFAARGLPLVEGYGLAEAGPVVALANPRNAQSGTVGPPLAGVEVRIDARPATRGQLLVKTPSRALGILEPAAPDQVVTGADWLETGDIATLDATGQLAITGRLKDVIALATGVKLPPAEVEQTLAEDEAVAQVCVVGDGLPWPVAVIVPEPGIIRRAVRQLGLRVMSRRGALEHPRLLAWLARRLARRQQQLPKAWRARRVFLVGRAFDAAHEEATESLKLRRGVIAEHFAVRIAAAVADPPPAWCGLIDSGNADVFLGRLSSHPAGAGLFPNLLSPTGSVADRQGWLIPAVWNGAGGGFAAAAGAAQAAIPSGVEAILERATDELGRLRASGELYEPFAGEPGPSPPIADPPPPLRGRFSRVAEEALATTGLWGLAVPEAYGGAGASLVVLSRAITRLAADVPTAAGLLAVHSSIGAVSAVADFGSEEQRARLLPQLAAGRPLSIFGATEADAGCDLGRVTSVLERRHGRLLLTGSKMFITGATHGRLVKLLAQFEGRPAIVVVQLPASDTASFRLRHYQLHPLKHSHNAALEFTGFEVDEADLLAPPAGSDAMAIVWHGLNRGRTTLAAQAAGTLRLMLAQAADHAKRRETWGRPIAARQLVQGRLGRIAASIVACDALSTWAAAAIESGAAGEWEAIIAKVVASGCVREAALDALGVHGGRAFLVGHPLGDSFHDHLAVGVYEGESDLLGLALFRGIAKAHPSAAAARRGRLLAWLSWRTAAWRRAAHPEDGRILDRQLRDHARQARRQLAKTTLTIERAIRRYGRGLADRQLEVGDFSARVRDLTSVLAVAHHADATGSDAAVRAADVWCRLARTRAAGRRPAPADLAAVARLGAESC